jgi:hypothetical protein
MAKEDVVLNVEAFSNQFKVLLLLVKPQREFFKRRRILVVNQADSVA